MTLSVWGTNATTVTAGSSTVLTTAMLQTKDSNPNAPTAPEIIYRVTTPPAHGTLSLSGTTTSLFTQQNVNDGLVVYHNDGSTTNDSFGYFVTVNQNAGVATPYTINFIEADTGGHHPVAGIYLGVLLDGASSIPSLIDSAGVQGGSGTGTTINLAITTTAANEPLIVGTWCSDTVAHAFLTPTLSCPAIGSFTHIGSYTALTGTATDSDTHNTVDWWRVVLSSPISSTLTATFSGTTAFSELFIAYWGFTGGSTFDTNASNFTVVQTGTLPATMTGLTPDAPDTRVLPLFLVAGLGDSVGAAGPAYPPGYHADGSGIGGSQGIFGARFRYTLSSTFTIGVVVPSPSSSLALDNLLCTAT